MNWLLFLALLLNQSYPLSSMEIFNTGAFACTTQKQMQTMEWRNEIGRDMVIRQAELWMGMYPGNVADFGFTMQRKSDGSNLFRGNWDHYANPTGINDEIVRESFAPDYFLLKKNDALILNYHCLNILQSQAEHKGHIIVTLWYY